MMKTIVVLAMALMLTGCGGGLGYVDMKQTQEGFSFKSVTYGKEVQEGKLSRNEDGKFSAVLGSSKQSPVQEAIGLADAIMGYRQPRPAEAK